MIVNKPYTNKEYADLASYCNKNDCHIEDKGDYLESVANEHPAPTEEELKAQVRDVRNSYLSYWDFTQLDDAPFTEEEKAFYREYRQYLRDYTEQENWWLQNPMTYEEWLVGHHPVENDPEYDVLVEG